MTDGTISVVIPTYNRRTALVRALAALSCQRFEGNFEVIVSVDGGTDDTLEVLGGLTAPFPLRVVSSVASRGAAAARNRGVEVASSPLIVFLDDDVEAAPDLLAAHARHHRSGATLTVGYYPPVTTRPLDFFRVGVRSSWESMFEAMRRPGHRYTFTDVLTGNCAIDAELFHRIEGFDEQFRCHEDYELGVRAIRAGGVLRYAPDARALHHERTTMARTFARKRDEGRADVAMLRKHPQLVNVLPLGAFELYATPTEFRIRRLVFEWPAAGRLVARSLTRSLAPLETARMRGRWRRRLNELLQYWYWRGVCDELPTRHDFDALRNACRAATRAADRIDIDLAHGLDHAMQALDAHRPDAATIRYGEELVGEIKPQAGAERLRGVHLKAALARELARPFVGALGRAHTLSVTSDAGHMVASGSLPTHTLAL